MTPTFQGEVMLAGWQESHNGGAKVTFWLPDATDLEAFRSMTVKKGNTAGQRLACVLVEIGDEEQPLEPATPKAEVGPLCKLAVRWCQDPQFQEWLKKLDALRWIALNGSEDLGEEQAKAVMLDICGIESRKELDTQQHPAAVFHHAIRIPYNEYLQQEGS
jgi:hypothetical protein